MSLWKNKYSHGVWWLCNCEVGSQLLFRLSRNLITQVVLKPLVTKKIIGVRVCEINWHGFISRSPLSFFVYFVLNRNKINEHPGTHWDRLPTLYNICLGNLALGGSVLPALCWETVFSSILLASLSSSVSLFAPSGFWSFLLFYRSSPILIGQKKLFSLPQRFSCLFIMKCISLNLMNFH